MLKDLTLRNFTVSEMRCFGGFTLAVNSFNNFFYLIFFHSEIKI